MISRVTQALVTVLIMLGVTMSVLAGLSTSVAAQPPSALHELVKRGTLRVGWSIWYPYVYRDSKTNELTGFAVEFINELGRTLNVKTEFMEDSTATMIAGLQAGKFDMTMPFAIALTRAQAVTFSAPFTKHGMGMMVLTKDLPKYRTWQDLDKPDKKISTTLGSNQDIVLTQQLKIKAQLLRTKAGPESVQQVLSGKADAWANNYDALHAVLKEHPELAIVPGPPFKVSEVAFMVRQGDFILADYLNLFIREQRESRNLARLIQKHGLDKAFPSE